MFQNLVDNEVLDVEASSIGELLEKLDEDYPELGDRVLDDGELRDNIMVLVNGQNIEFLDKLDTDLDEDDRVAIFPPVAGG